MMKIIDWVRGIRRITIQENQRIIALEKGRFMGILGSGEHRIKVKNVQMDVHDLNVPEFNSKLSQALFRERPDLVEAHLTEVRTGEDEIAIILRDGRIKGVLKPGSRRVFWTDAGPWDVERVDISTSLELAPKLAKRLIRAGMTESVAAFEVGEGFVGLMAVEGAFARVLKAGTHRFWGVGRKITVKLIDTRWRAHDVTGQEILTADRVTLRVNLSADFRVTDPVKAASEVKDFTESLHRALQFAFRKTLGAKTLDQLLGEKVSVDAEAAEQVRGEMAQIGVEVGAISLKDVVLPGEMREILNGVVAAAKEAEANVIRRREETNATRSLLNTAKVMAENPVMLRLKELEALEVIAGKVERLTIHSGTEGLMNDLVKLRD